MTDKQTPPDWVLIEAAKRSGKEQYFHHIAADDYKHYPMFRALCDMIERYEQPPVDRKLLCAEEAVRQTEHWSMKECAIRAIELWEEGFGK